MTLTRSELNVIGLGLSEAIAFADELLAPLLIEELLDGLSVEDLKALVVRSNEVFVNSATKQTKFRNWLAELVDEALDISPDSPATVVLVAVEAASELIFSEG